MSSGDGKISKSRVSLVSDSSDVGGKLLQQLVLSDGDGYIKWPYYTELDRWFS